MSMTIRYTKGFLLDFKKRIEFIKSAHNLLEMKRDQLMRSLKERLEKLRDLRKKVMEETKEINKEFAFLHAAYGSQEVETISAFLDEKAQVTIIPKSIIGVTVPLVKEINIPSMKGRCPYYIAPLAEKAATALVNLIKLAELEAEIESILEDLKNTNIRVNALEKVVIPRYRQLIKYIQDVLDHEMLEEFMRTKLVKNVLSKRRGGL